LETRIFEQSSRAVKKIIFLLFILPAFLSCKKENDKPQWVVNVVGPLAYASLGVNNFIADSLINVDSTNAIALVYERNFENSRNINLDSLFQIPDTTIPTQFIFPYPSFLLMQSTTFFAPTSSSVTLGISGVELKEVIIKSGYLKLEARNRVQARIVYTYKIPGAVDASGNSFQVTTTMDSAAPGGYTSYVDSFDMSGYTVDLRGPNGNSFNKLTYNIIARTDTGITPVTIFVGDTLVNINASLKDIVPYYAKGYLGQTEIDGGYSSEDFNIFSFVQSGHVRFEDVKLKFTIENSIGVDAQAFIMQLQSVNTHAGSVVNMVSPLINNPINLNRATESGNPLSPVNPSVSVITFDNSNSNLRTFIENFPDRLNYHPKLKINPLGNISFSNDFIYTDYLGKTTVRAEMPLSFAADHLTVGDTSALVIENPENFDPLGDGKFTLIAENGFPFAASIQLLVLDENNVLLDTIPVTGTIAAGITNADFRVIAPARSLIPVYIDAVRKQHILHGKHLAFKASFTTPAFPQYYRIYTDYKLDVKLVADAAYLIH
jgi:hypothetical protein